ncbi:MAG TPA: recombinase family protein [Armatimonadota bacterium]|jgi:DNA invertase Pin-like site-specific DNA recombinase
MSASDPSLVPLPGAQKVTPRHRQGLACVYVRQSCLKQVENNRESQINQYRLAEKAQALGWPPEQVRVIDSDLGLSAQSSDDRSGFKELVAEVSLGHVGLVLGYEVSRLARNNSDWYHLLDLAAVFGTLIADSDGLYDPRSYNDRLLLGLKGTMSEAELHLLRQRLDAGRLTQVQRNAYRQQLPTGLERRLDGTVVKDPDDQVRHTLELVFEKFEELGTAHAVMRYLRQAEIRLPRRQRCGPQRGEVLWKVAADWAVRDILRNPAYAGAFAYGRRQLEPSRLQPGFRATGRLARPEEEWLHLAQGIYPAYLSWEQFEANQERLRANSTLSWAATQEGAGPVREGAALLQGLVFCGACGRRMRTVYRGATYRYACEALAKERDLPRCGSLLGPALDERVAEAFLAVLQPAQLSALEALLADQQQERERLSRHWEERLKRERYEAGLAERQYRAVDPENRLVAAELERRWEETLRRLQATQQEYERFRRTLEVPQLSEEQKQLFAEISTRLPGLWESGELSPPQKKELLRSLVDRVVARRWDSGTVELRILWVSGHYTETVVRHSVTRLVDVADYDRLVLRVEALWREGLTDEAIAARLTEEGLRSARSRRIPAQTIQQLRLERGWYQRLHRSRGADEVEGYLTVRGLAVRLGVRRGWVYRWLARNPLQERWVLGHPKGGLYLIRADEELLAQLRRCLPGKPGRPKGH